MDIRSLRAYVKEPGMKNSQIQTEPKKTKRKAHAGASSKRTKLNLQLAPSSVDELIDLVKLSASFRANGEPQLRYIVARQFVQPLDSYHLDEDDQEKFLSIILRTTTTGEPGDVAMLQQMLAVFLPKLQQYDPGEDQGEDQQSE